MSKYLSDITAVNLRVTKSIYDKGGTERITLATASPQVTLTGDVKVSAHMALRGLTPSSTISLHLGDTTGSTGSFTVINAGHKTTTSGNSNTLEGLKAQNLTMAVTSGSTGHSVTGLAFINAITGGGGGATVTLQVGIDVANFITSFTGTITERVGIRIRSGSILFGTPVITTQIGLDIQNMGHSSSTDVYGVIIRSGTSGTNRYGIYVENITGGTIADLINLRGTSIAHFQVKGTGTWTAAANETPVFIAEGATPTARQLKTRVWDGTAGHGMTNGDLICYLV